MVSQGFCFSQATAAQPTSNQNCNENWLHFGMKNRSKWHWKSIIELVSITTSILYYFGPDFRTILGTISVAFGLKTGGLQLRFPPSLACLSKFCLRDASETLPGEILTPFWVHFGSVFASCDDRFAGLMRAGAVPRSANNLDPVKDTFPRVEHT